MSQTYFLLRQNVPQVKKEEPPLSLYGQLLWREFFYTAATKNPNFDRMYGNPICVQIPWDKNPEVRTEKRKEFTPKNFPNFSMKLFGRVKLVVLYI